MGPEHHTKVSYAADTLKDARTELAESVRQRANALEMQLASLPPHEHKPALIQERNIAYTRTHQLLVALWNADESKTLGPRAMYRGGRPQRAIQPEGYPAVVLTTHASTDLDPDGQRNYGIDYAERVGNPSGPHVLEGLDNKWCVFSESGTEGQARAFGDPRGLTEGVSDIYILKSAANFLENVDTLEGICQAAGVATPEPVAA